jgi:hypothetical protein
LTPPPTQPSEPEVLQCTAVIGDLVASRALSSQVRTSVQERLTQRLERFNREHAHALVADFLVTLGDEFQGLLGAPHAVADLMWDLETHLPEVHIRYGLGFGPLPPPYRPVALGMDGPAFHAARAAIRVAHDRQRLVLTQGFGQDDEVLAGLGGLLRWHRDHWTVSQRLALAGLREGLSQTDVAQALGVTRQAISLKVRATGWAQYLEAEAGWCTLLSRYDTTEGWRR